MEDVLAAESRNPSRPPHPRRARPHHLGTSRWPRLCIPTYPNDPSGRIPAVNNSSSSESDQAVRRTCRFSSPCPLADSVWFPLLIVSPFERSKPFFRFLELVWKHRAMKRNGAQTDHHDEAHGSRQQRGDRKDNLRREVSENHEKRLTCR